MKLYALILSDEAGDDILIVCSTHAKAEEWANKAGLESTQYLIEEYELDVPGPLLGKRSETTS